MTKRSRLYMERKREQHIIKTFPRYYLSEFKRCRDKVRGKKYAKLVFNGVKKQLPAVTGYNTPITQEEWDYYRRVMDYQTRKSLIEEMETDHEYDGWRMKHHWMDEPIYATGPVMPFDKFMDKINDHSAPASHTLQSPPTSPDPTPTTSTADGHPVPPSPRV